MAQGPILIFDKSSLESLNLDEAVLLDNFYMSNITPLFSLSACRPRKAIRAEVRRTTRRIFGNRTPKRRPAPTFTIKQFFQGELTRHFD